MKLAREFLDDAAVEEGAQSIGDESEWENDEWENNSFIELNNSQPSFEPIPYEPSPPPLTRQMRTVVDSVKKYENVSIIMYYKQNRTSTDK